MKILLTGGGTGGSVAPLLAIKDEIQQQVPHAKFLFVGSSAGPERQMAEHVGLQFESVPAGKWRRYFSWQNFLMPFQICAGLLKSFAILRKFRPSIIIGTGSFVQVPVMWMAWILRVPILIHQQDVVPSLANKLAELCASKITVTFEKSLKDFPSRVGVFDDRRVHQKIIFTGNPFRTHLTQADPKEAKSFFQLTDELPVLFVTGGGTGSQFINQLVKEALPELTKIVQIIHQTGSGKNENIEYENYHVFEFIKDMDKAYAAADFVLCRAGLSTITELSNLGKVSIIIPIPDSHQEQNAFYLAERHAAIGVTQDTATPELIMNIIRKLLFNLDLQNEIKRNISKIMPKDGGKKIAELAIILAREHSSHAE